MTKEEIPKIVAGLDKYIDSSSKYAADMYTKSKLYLEVVDGVRYDMTPDACAVVYRDLIIELLTEERAFKCKYLLFAMVIPIGRQPDGTLIMSIKLGVLFPEVPL